MTPEGTENARPREHFLQPARPRPRRYRQESCGDGILNLPIRAMFPVPYHFSLLPILLCAAGVLALTLAITALAARRLRSREYH